MNKVLAIVGSHPIARGITIREDADVWVFNEAAGTGWTGKVDGVFQMHKEAIWKNPKNRNDPQHHAWLRAEHDYPIWMMQVDPDVPASVAYPLEEVYNHLLSGFTKGDVMVQYFTSSVAYALALGIHLQYSEIELYGVEMETNTEYAYQRDGVYFWLGVAVGKGIQVKLMPKSGLFAAPLYGYEGDVELHQEEFEGRLVELKEQALKIARALEDVSKRQTEALDVIIKSKDIETRKLAEGNLADAIKAQSKLIVDWGVINGAVQQNQQLIERAKAMDEAAGEHVFVRQEFEWAAAMAQEMGKPKEAIMFNIGGQATTSWKTLKASQNGNRKSLAKEYKVQHEKYLKAAFEYGMVLGAYRENVRYLAKLDQLIKAAGGMKAEEAILGEI